MTGALRVCRSRVSAPVAPKAVTATGSGSRSDSESEAWWRGGRERLPRAEGGFVEDGREEGVELEGLEARENFFMVKGPGGPLEEDMPVLGALKMVVWVWRAALRGDRGTTRCGECVFEGG